MINIGKTTNWRYLKNINHFKIQRLNLRAIMSLLTFLKTFVEVFMVMYIGLCNFP